MKQRVQIYVLVGLVVVAGYFFFSSHQSGPGVGVLASDVKFVPLNVDEPQLRLDLLAELKELTYKGVHRDIFNPNSVPITSDGGGSTKPPKPPHPYPTVQPPPPIPPPQVPGTLYGYATLQTSGKRVAFFQEGDDVLVVEEGAEFLHGYRLIHVNDTTADVVELSTGRHATVQMTQPDRAPNGGGGGGDAGANQ
jgi:hypothetical protein